MDYYGALEDYNKVLLLNPENIYTYYNRAVIKHILEDFHGAINDYTKAIELFPDFAGAYLNRSDARQQSADEKGAYLDYQKAVSIIDRINTSDFDSLLVQEYADSAYFSRIIEFEADFVALQIKEDVIPDRSIDLAPAFLIMFASDDYLFVEKSRLGYTSPQLEQLNQTRPLGYRLIFSNELPEIGDGNVKKLMQEADSLVNSNPYSANAYFLRGVVNSMLRNYQTALKDYDMALFIDPDMGLAYLNRSWVHFEMAEHSTFEARYSTPVIITWGELPDPEYNDPPASPDYSKAMADLDAATRLLSGVPFPYLNRGNLKVRLKDYTGAVADFTEATNTKPKLPEPWFNRALTLLFLNNNLMACEDLSQAGERGLVEAYQVIGRYCK
jgi:tetratricopeptide (TPR) repeat protein